MIARYFGSKEGLYLATLAEAPGEGEIDFEPAALLALLIEWWDERGHSPISRALASPALTPEVGRQVREVIRRRILIQLTAVLRERGVPDPGLRAETLVALAVGVAMTRANGTLEELAGAPREDLLAVLGPAVEALAS